MSKGMTLAALISSMQHDFRVRPAQTNFSVVGWLAASSCLSSPPVQNTKGNDISDIKTRQSPAFEVLAPELDVVSPRKGRGHYRQMHAEITLQM